MKIGSQHIFFLILCNHAPTAMPQLYKFVKILAQMSKELVYFGFNLIVLTLAPLHGKQTPNVFQITRETIPLGLAKK